MNDYSFEISKKIALLNDGSKVEYDNCCTYGRNYYNLEKFLYIGTGKVYSVDGVIQNSTETLDFYERIPDE
jgi:hypothetical protein